MGGGGKKGGQKRIVVDYFMSIHFGICHGPVDALLNVWIKEKNAWPGEMTPDDKFVKPFWYIGNFAKIIRDMAGLPAPAEPLPTKLAVTAEGMFPIDRLDLFGGDEKEGGAKGEAYFLPGGSEQRMPEHLAAKYGMTSGTMPGYRGLATVMFTGWDNGAGFMWSQNNPYLPSTWVTVFRQAKGLNEWKRTISDTTGTHADVNPANIIYEALTDPQWGMGGGDTSLDINSFLHAQDVLFNERFGLSLMWSQQTTIEAFVSEILDHIQATLFLNPTNGLLTLKLIRDDYVFDELPIYNPDNCDLESRSRKAWGETINEINIRWTNPENEEQETVTFQDLGNVVMQGGQVVSETREYYGIRNKELAAFVGARDIRTASQPLFAATMIADRSAWKRVPGECIRLQWPEDGLLDVVMRVMKVDYGTTGQPDVKVELMEDIFSQAPAAYVVPPVTEWIDPTSKPRPMDYVEIVTAPYPMLSRMDTTLTEEMYPRVMPVIFAASEEFDAYGYNLVGTSVLATGAVVESVVTSAPVTPRGEITGNLSVEASSLMTTGMFGQIDGSGELEPGLFAALGSGGDANMELVLLDSFNATTNTWTVSRGIFDTVPKAWPPGTPIWFLTSMGFDTTDRAAGTVARYKLLTKTSGGILPREEAPEHAKLLSDRPYLPFRPANVKVGGTGIGAGRRVYTSAQAVTVTWANRNRFLEDTVAYKWDAANSTPEEGQTTVIEVLDDFGTVIETLRDLPGTTASVPYTAFKGWRFPRIRVSSERDGFRSLQGVEIGIEFRLFGYGNFYGSDYGENNG